MFVFLKLFKQLSFNSKNQFTRMKAVFFTSTGPRALKQKAQNQRASKHSQRQNTGQSKIKDPN